MNITFGYSPYLAIPIILLAGLASYLFYRQTRDLLSGWTQLLLGLFRFFVLSIIGILLLQPLLSSFAKVSYVPIVAILQDVSESLVIHKDSAFIKEKYPEDLKEFIGSFDEKDFALDTYQYSSGIESDFEPDSLSFDKRGTNIAYALEEVNKLYRNQNLGAMVLVSDGISTEGNNPLYTVDRFTHPVYTVLVGDTTPQQDVRIKEVLHNDIAYLKDEMPIKVKVSSEGYNQAELQVKIRDDDKEIASESIVLSESKPQGELNFYIKPQEVGLQQYTISISRMENEVSYRNNQRKIFVNVLETRVNIAILAGSPHPDLGALSEAFSQDERYEVSQFVRKTPNSFYESSGAVNFSDFDLFILHNFPATSQDGPVVKEIAEIVEKEKKPFILFVGKFTDLSTIQPLVDYMAILPRSYSLNSEEVIINFLPKYKDHSTFTFSDRWIQWANSSPPIFRNRSNWEARNTAELFATAKIKNIELDYPVFAIQNYLGRKNMIFLGENFWRFRAHSFLESESFDLFDEWLFNNVKWLIVSDDKRKFKVEPSERIFTGNDPIRFTGQVYDDSYNPVSGVEIKLTLISPDNTEEEYYLSESRDAQYYFELAGLEEGTYKYRAVGNKGGRLLGTDRGEFSIGTSSIEHYNLQADKAVMRQIALRSGGEFIHVSNMSELPDKIKDLPNLVPKVDYKRSRQSFHHLHWILFLILSFLSVEWIIRKYHSLS